MEDQVTVNAIPLQCISLLFPYLEFRPSRALRLINRCFNAAGKLKLAWNSKWNQPINVAGPTVDLSGVELLNTIDNRFTIQFNCTPYAQHLCLASSSYMTVYSQVDKDDELQLDFNKIQQCLHHSSLSLSYELKQSYPRNWWTHLFLFKTLKVLELSSDLISGNFMFVLVTFLPNLESFRTNPIFVRDGPTQTPQGFNKSLFLQSLGKMQHLKELWIHLDFIGGGIKYLSTTPLAQSLTILYCRNDSYPGFPGNPMPDWLFLNCFGKLSQVLVDDSRNWELALWIVRVHKLSLSPMDKHNLLQNRASSEGMFIQMISEFNQLTNLNCSGSNWMSCATFKAITRIKTLTQLNLSGSLSDNSYYDSIGSLANLQSLNVSRTKFSCTTIEQGYWNGLTQLTDLNLLRINLSQHAFERLVDICGASLCILILGDFVHDSGNHHGGSTMLHDFQSLQKCTQLHRLWLHGDEVHDHGMRELWLNASLLHGLFSFYPSRLFNLSLSGGFTFNRHLIDWLVLTQTHAGKLSNLSLSLFSSREQQVTMEDLQHLLLLPNLTVLELDSYVSVFPSDMCQRLRAFYDQTHGTKYNKPYCVITVNRR